MKHIFHDIIPKEKRSIRNIPLSKKGESDIEESFTTPTKTLNTTPDRSPSPIIHHSMDGLRPKTISAESVKKQTRSEPAFTEGRSKDFKDANSTNSQPDEDDDYEEDEYNTDGVEVDTQSKTTDEDTFEEWNKHHKKSYARAIIALTIFCGVSLFLTLSYFGGATITINPVRHDVVLKETKISLQDIGHETITTELDGTDEVEANGTAKVERKATGKIILYNAYNSSVQKLVVDTRLETPNGLIYKLKSGVSIPGQKTVNGKAVPGSIEAEVEASETGEKYNQGFKDFNVVAYKGSDRYEGIYGRSKTALANGFSGTVPNISSKDIASSTALIKEKINTQADAYFAKKAKEKGSNFVYIPSTKKLVFKEVKSDISKDGKKATLTLEATASAVLFDSTTLFAQIIKNQTEQIGEQVGSETNFDSTKEIVYTGDFSKLSIGMKDESSIQVTGTTSISSAIDEIKVTRAVSGLSKEQAIGAIKRLVELETIEIDIRPWWNKKLPDARKIKIQTEN
ncbi:MAG: hypothetical protein QG568_357 [Patescibacteria group bacterium]|nr:hypothetical protein [Patescibacteria group bacterium]